MVELLDNGGRAVAGLAHHVLDRYSASGPAGASGAEREEGHH